MSFAPSSSYWVSLLFSALPTIYVKFSFSKLKCICCVLSLWSYWILMTFELEYLEIFKRLVYNMSYWDAKVIVVPCAIIFDLLFAYIWSRLIVFFEFPSSKFIHFLWRTLTFKISAFVYLLQTS